MLQMIRRGDMSTAVYQLQTALQQCGVNIKSDGNFGPGTEAAVKDMQRRLGLAQDGLVGPSTIRALKLDLRPTLLRESDFEYAAKRLKCDPRTIKALTIVEAPKGGFNVDGTPTILYERHYFDKLFVWPRKPGQTREGLVEVREKIRASQRDVSWPKPFTFKKVYDNGNAVPSIDRYGAGAWQYERLNRARQFSDTVALQSASWGKFQIMGENALRCGWSSVQAFVRAMEASERDHLDAVIAFLHTKPGLVDAVRGNDWRTIARLYNGPSQVDYYAPRLAAAFKSQ